MSKLTSRMELKMRDDTFSALQEIYEKHKISPAEMCRSLAELAVDYYKKNGRIGFPLILSEAPVEPTSPAQIDISMDPKPNKAKSREDRIKKHLLPIDEGDSQVSIQPGLLQPDLTGARYRKPVKRTDRKKAGVKRS